MAFWPPRIFYGWYVVYAIGFVLMTTSGLAFYNLSILLDAFVAERGFPVALTSGATASFFIASGTGGVFAAQLMDRIDARAIMIFGACLSAIALGSLSLLQSAWQLYGFHLLFGFCYGFCGLVPATAVVARWFEARRALALSIASTGLSLGGVIMAPLSAFLIQRLGIAGARPGSDSPSFSASCRRPHGSCGRARRRWDSSRTAPNSRSAARHSQRDIASPMRRRAAAGSSWASPPRICSGSAHKSAPSPICSGWRAPARAPGSPRWRWR
jgi:Major Facilitator Superfamily